MARTVLILTEPGDLHAYAVAEALKLKGGRPLVWQTSDFPSVATESVMFEHGKKSVRLSALNVDLADFGSALTVWHRRPAFAVDRQSLHPCDVQFAEQECAVFRRSILSAISPDSFWVNPLSAAINASKKLVQQQLAIEIGFSTPDTLYTNDPELIRSFIRSHNGIIVYKPFRGQPWRGTETYWLPYTSLLREEQLVPDSTLRNVPGIYQELVPKAFELRVTAMGEHVVAAKILSQDTRDGRVDWRKAYSELKMEPYMLPVEIAENCRLLIRRLGLAFGCFDLVVTPAGHYVFLEVNEMGQFLFVESHTGQHLLDAFSEFLLQGACGFSWEESRASLRYSDVLPAAEAATIRSKNEHVRPPEQSFSENKPPD